MSDRQFPEIREPRSPLEVIDVAERHFGERPISVLEIGVFQAGLTKRLRNAQLKIIHFDGVDPFLGTPDALYIGAYWKDESGANGVFKKASRVFEEYGYHLHRKTSKQFKEHLEDRRRYDLIYVDGDHSMSQALWDMCAFFQHIEDDGLFMVDDYANVDVPQVTSAFN